MINDIFESLIKEFEEVETVKTNPIKTNPQFLKTTTNKLIERSV